MKVTEKAPAFYDVFERKTGPAQAGHALLPRLRPRHRPQADRRGDRRIWASRNARSSCRRSAAACSPTTTSTSATSRPPTAGRRPWPPASSGPAPDRSSSPTRATATWRPSARPRSIHAANRGENITVFFVNNAIYGMTGGQMAPTTLDRPEDRPPRRWAVSARCMATRSACARLLATLPAPTYIERVAIGDGEAHPEGAQGDPQGPAEPGRGAGATASSRSSPPARPAGRWSRSTPASGCSPR